MPFSLTPRWVFQHYSEITPDWLRQQGITLLLSDLDFYIGRQEDPSAGISPCRTGSPPSARRGSVS